MESQHLFKSMVQSIGVPMVHRQGTPSGFLMESGGSWSSFSDIQQEVGQVDSIHTADEWVFALCSVESFLALCYGPVGEDDVVKVTCLAFHRFSVERC